MLAKIIIFLFLRRVILNAENKRILFIYCKTFMYSELFYRIALQHIEGFGNATLKKMLRFSGSATKLFTEPDLWKTKVNKRTWNAPQIVLSEATIRLVEQEMIQMEKHNINLCFYLDTNYPYRLKNCTDSPISFFYQGEPIFNRRHLLAVVGTRDATEYGRNTTRKILTELRDTDLVTVSGLAYGIDTEAHQRSIENNIPTIAVLGSGLGHVYPHSNIPLAQRILEQGGTLVSEFPFYTIPDRTNFPRRNRIIAGLSDAILVVESAEKGGSIITAHIAHSYNRDIFAVPGSIFEPLHSGCHELIRQNMAAIVTSGQEIVEMMNWCDSQPKSTQTAMFVELNKDEESIVNVLQTESTSIDKLSETLPIFSPSKLAGLLLTLELKGVITCKPGKVYALNA